MRRSRFSLLAFAAAILMAGVLATPARATDDDLSYARIVRLSYATGDVQIVRAGDAEKWEPAFANMPIQQGFTIGTNNGAAEIEFEHGSALWLASEFHSPIHRACTFRRRPHHENDSRSRQGHLRSGSSRSEMYSRYPLHNSRLLPRENHNSVLTRSLRADQSACLAVGFPFPGRREHKRSRRAKLSP